MTASDLFSASSADLYAFFPPSPTLIPILSRESWERESRAQGRFPWIPDLRFAASGMTHLERRCSDGETGHFRQRHLHLRALPALRGEKKKKCRIPAKAGIHRNCHSSQDSGSPLHRVRNDGLWDNPVLRGKAVVPGKQAKAPSPSCSSCLRGGPGLLFSPLRSLRFAS
mgnify:CR=1 FL=1